MLVIHEPQPPGLREVTIKRNVGEALGLNICGGIGSPPANPLDKSDEGIFIEKVSFICEEAEIYDSISYTGYYLHKSHLN